MSKLRGLFFGNVAFLLMLFISLFLPGSSFAAVSFTIDAPSGELTRNQSYDFTVNINTGTDAVSSIQANVSYDTAALQLVSVTQGNFFDSVTYQETTPGTILLSGTNSAAKSGSGTFAIIKFTLIATSSGSTTLCTVSPVETPTPTVPGATAAPTATPGAGAGPTITPVPTSPPVPTSIPSAGAITGWQIGILASLVLLGMGAIGMLLL